MIEVDQRKAVKNDVSDILLGLGEEAAANRQPFYKDGDILWFLIFAFILNKNLFCA